MIRNVVFLMVLTIGFVSCKSPEARQPLQRTSGTFIEESIERNKKIIEEEEALIKKMMDANPQHSYIASESGFGTFIILRILLQRKCHYWAMKSHLPII